MANNDFTFIESVMKISQIYNLNKSQAELDFVDIDPDGDLPIFLDPFFLSKRNDRWSIEATLTLRSFFQKVIDCIRLGQEALAKELFNHLHEPNATCLGLSKGNPCGRGIGNNDTDRIYEGLLSSKAIQTGLIQDIEDNILFVENFGKDKLSDMTTNILNRHLIKYTQNQCKLNNIPLTLSISSGFYWNRQEGEWQNEYTEMLVYNGRKILLVPKGIVSFCRGYTPERYYNQFVLEFLQNESLQLKSALVQRRINGTPFVTKKSLKEVHPLNKDFLRRFTRNHPEVLQSFKDQTDIESLANLEIAESSINEIAKNLISQLESIPYGPAHASAFHNLIIGILEIIFYPHLVNPVKEQEINQRRKRIDICFDNASKNGIFNRLSEKFKIFCPYIFVECKNYSRDIANPELDQIAGRFSVNRGQVGFVVCRTIDDMPLFIQRCKDTYKDQRGLIIPLVDEDMIVMLKNINDLDTQFICSLP